MGRLVEFVDAVGRLLDGESVTVDGHYLRLVDARLEDFPVKGRVRLVVGGGNREVLRVGAARADVVALSGLGRTLPGGHRHEVRWSSADVHAQVRFVRQESQRSGTTPEIEALVQEVTITENRPQALDDLSKRLGGVSLDVLDATPFVLVGTIEEIATQLVRHRNELSITRYVVREAAIEPIERVLSLLNDR